MYVTLPDPTLILVHSTLTRMQEKLNEAVAMMNRNLQEVNVQNMNVELVAQMFKNYQSNVLFHLEGLSQNYKHLDKGGFEGLR